MKRRDFIASAAAASSLAGCGVFTASYTLRYRLTLTAKVDGVLRTGSSVLKTTWVDAGPLSQMGRWVPKYWGDAIIVWRNERSALIGLLAEMPGHDGGFSPSNEMFYSLIGPVNQRPYDENELFERLEDLQGVHDIPSNQRPHLTYISNVNDIRSAILLPAETQDGRFSIQDFTLQITQDSITTGIKSKVPGIAQVGTFPFRASTPPKDLPLYEQFETRNFYADGGTI
jgi:hypothetical protein